MKTTDQKKIKEPARLMLLEGKTKIQKRLRGDGLNN